jgi:ADP-heptose:LPS heptosyltransferase
MSKFLIIRFSSIGDIVLTSPVVRSLKQAHPDAEVHFLTKSAYAPLLHPNPYIDRIHAFDGDWRNCISALKKHRFTHILDLHSNLRSLRVKLALRRPSSTFNKQNINKYLLTKPLLRPLAGTIAHVVERYGATLHPLGIQLDQEGLDFFLPEGKEAEAKDILQQHLHTPQPAFAVVLGATHRTKRWIPAQFVSFLNQLGKSAVLLGGPDIREEADEIIAGLEVPYLDAVGKYDLFTSAALMKACQQVITHDTGLMHIAAAFQQPMVTLWGNTVPEFGMTPYKAEHVVREVEGLACRPCSKIGFGACPKGHFRCMRGLEVGENFTPLST